MVRRVLERHGSYSELWELTAYSYKWQTCNDLKSVDDWDGIGTIVFLINCDSNYTISYSIDNITNQR